ncbi:MAG: HEAT repeat domain-containing protein [Chloroflexota bacterium]
MSKPSWDDLTGQLSEAKRSRQRRAACRKLAATGDPAVIPFLRNAYLQDDDEGVRDAAREALAVFKARQEGRSARRFPPGRRFLRVVTGALAVLLLVSLALNGLALLGEDSDDANDQPSGSLFDQPPTPRDDVIAHVEARLRDAESLAANLRAEITQYNATGQVVCDFEYSVPEPVGLAAIDQVTYPDLRIATMNVDVALPTLQKALLLLNGACLSPAAQTERVLAAAMELDKVDGQLQEASEQLQRAIVSPAPTVGPTITPLPTHTLTPTPTATPSLTPTPATPTATAPPSAALPASSTPTPTVSPTPTRTPTVTPSLTPTLPFPDLDYRAILSALRERYAVMGDLKNSYGTGMIDQWEQALSPQGQTSTSYCALARWPAAFALTPEQQALLDAPNAADPQLADAIRLQQEGLALAQEARALYEASCWGYNLAGSAEQGLPLANEALTRLAQSQNLYDLIRARPSG